MPIAIQHARRPRSWPLSHLGFTLLEIMMVMGIGALLLALAVPTYNSVQDRLKVSQASQDLLRLAQEIGRYRTAHDFRLPDSLAELGVAGLPTTDPWGGAYRYLSFSSNIPGINGMIRKDHNLHPLNSEFDLYSMGPDGASRSPLTAAASRDDIIWARDGSFVGRASDF